MVLRVSRSSQRTLCVRRTVRYELVAEVAEFAGLDAAVVDEDVDVVGSEPDETQLGVEGHFVDCGRGEEAFVVVECAGGAGLEFDFDRAVAVE